MLGESATISFWRLAPAVSSQKCIPEHVQPMGGEVMFLWISWDDAYLSQISNCMRTWSLRVLRQFVHLALSALHVLATAASAAFKSRATLQLENLALRHQLGVLRRSVKRPKLTSADRFLWVWLCQVSGVRRGCGARPTADCRGSFYESVRKRLSGRSVAQAGHDELSKSRTTGSPCGARPRQFPA